MVVVGLAERVHHVVRGDEFAAYASERPALEFDDVVRVAAGLSGDERREVNEAKHLQQANDEGRQREGANDRKRNAVAVSQ